MSKLVIHIVCNDGSPLGVGLKDLYGDNGRTGLGGAEQALVTLCEYWNNQGYDITLYNNPSHPDISPFKQKMISEFNPDEQRDVCITFRSPNLRTLRAKGKKVWFSCDQRTVGDFASFAQTQDEIVVISPFHAKYFADTYRITKTTIIDLPVRIQDYNLDIQKVEKQCLFSSVPDRGLPILAKMWPYIQERTDASLIITSGWSLWTGRDDSTLLFPYRMMFRGQKNVNYVGALKRRELNLIQCQSQVLTYPNIYHELFCYSVAEACVAGCYPITSTIGALETTNMGTLVEGNPLDTAWQFSWADEVVHKLNSESLSQDIEDIKVESRQRFSLDRIGKEWEKVFNG